MSPAVGLAGQGQSWGEQREAWLVSEDSPEWSNLGTGGEELSGAEGGSGYSR